MYLKDLINKIDKNIKLYVDMDGVVADYDLNTPMNYDKKRPLITSINKITEVSELPNVETHILSISRTNLGVKEKNIWLDKYMPYIKQENRHIISKEIITDKTSAQIKLEFLQNVEKNNAVLMLIDDDQVIIKTVHKEIEDIICLKDSVLVD